MQSQAPKSAPNSVRPKRPVPVWAIILIIVGSLVMTCVVIYVIWLLFALKTIGESANTLGTPDESISTQKSETTEYASPRMSFRHPVSWELKDVSNMNVAAPGEFYYDTRRSSTPDGIILDYRESGTNETPSTEVIDYDTLKTSMQDSIPLYKNASSSQIQGFETSYSRGCNEDAAMVGEPSLKEVDGIVGIKYTFTCRDMYGTSAQGATMLWYAPTGIKHRITVSMPEYMWNKNVGDVEAVFDSISPVSQ